VLCPNRPINANGDQWSLDKKLVGKGTVGKSAPSVALSANGAVVIVGGFNDRGGIGAAWVFTRSSDSWTQDQDKKLTDTGVAVKTVPSVEPSTVGSARRWLTTTSLSCAPHADPSSCSPAPRARPCSRESRSCGDDRAIGGRPIVAAEGPGSLHNSDDLSSPCLRSVL
jgi:hypothetical protein